ncbi:MAG: hypothetical protein L6R38_007048 [Xanthoria sp. 2 TBL-2021]|nr:MAG: hypothetical protein L6R38_007048 [Xanthoria sp. 2 TBL-2021]
MSLSDSGIVPKIEAMLANAKKLKADGSSARVELLKQVELLQQDLEPPINLFFKTWISLTVFTCLDIAVKLGIFEQMKTWENITARELGGLVNVDSNVIGQT